MNLDQTKTLSEIIGIWFTIVALLLGGGFALFEYLDQKQETRLEATVSHVREFRREPMHSINRKLSKSEQTASYDATKLLKEFPSETVAQHYYKFIIQRVEDDDLAADLDQMINFYEEVVICVYTGICDRDSAENYFFLRGRNFYRTYYPYICSEREKWRDLSTGRLLQAFFNPSATTDPCEQ